MTDGREHSRSGPAAKHAASAGASQIRATDAGADVGEGGQEAEEQAFARSGQFTGRPIPPQDVVVEPAPDEQVEGDIGQLQDELAQTTAHLQRLAADFDNFRKRAIREREAAKAGADAKLLGELLVVLDDFERAIEVGSAEGATTDGLLEGVRMIDGRLRMVLNGAGLTDVPTDGQFDPHLHEALLVQPGSGMPEGSIITVVQRGYSLGDRVVRHAKVIVAGGD